MGDCYVYIVSCDPWLAPSLTQGEAACDVVKRALKSYDDFETSKGETVQFFYNCEGGWDTNCSRCGRGMPMSDFTDWLDEDYDRQTGFRLVPRAMPCCGTSLSVKDLAFDPPAGFAKFAIEIRNPLWKHGKHARAPHAVEISSDGYARMPTAQPTWREIRTEWPNEVNAGIERLVEQVGGALGTEVLMVWSKM